MCIFITKKGFRCQISPEKKVCHIHKKYSVINHSKNEIRNLNKTIEKNSKTITTLKNENKQLKKENENLKVNILEMKEGYENYKKIRDFEIKKSNLGNYIHDLTDFYELKIFLRSDLNKKILVRIFGEHDDYWKHYNDLRIIRNRLCHDIAS